MFAYSYNNPVNYSDPSGYHAVIEDAIAYGGGGGGIGLWAWILGVVSNPVAQEAGVLYAQQGPQITEGAKNTGEKLKELAGGNGGGGSNPDPNKFNKVKSLIKNDPGLVKQAEKMGKNEIVQKEVNKLVEAFLNGNNNPGLGTKNLFIDIFYFRGREGARVYYNIKNGVMNILGKSSKANQQKVINILSKLYK